MSTQLFNCPACGAALDYKESAQEEAGIVECPYCHNSVIVPAELRPAAEPVEVENLPSMESIAAPPVQPIKLTPQQIRLIWLFVLIVFVLPTCIGIGASILGVIVGIAAPLLTIFLPWLLGAK